MKERAVVFDFDGTLLDTGPDKGVHVLYAAWVACFSHGYKAFLHPQDPAADIARMLEAYCRYPGAPRFEQLSAVINAIVSGRYSAVKDPGDLGLGSELTACYEDVRREYNTLYSSLNDTAAGTYWKPFPTAKAVLAQLGRDFDLYVASGLIQEVMEVDFDFHEFDRNLFRGLFGSDDKGTRNKGLVLTEIKASGYRDVLFAGDSTKDQEYAIQAGVRFFRIRRNGDFDRLVATDPFDLPDEKEPWDFSTEELQFFREKSVHALQAFCSGNPLGNDEICKWNNS